MSDSIHPFEYATAIRFIGHLAMLLQDGYDNEAVAALSAHEDQVRDRVLEQAARLIEDRAVFTSRENAAAVRAMKAVEKPGAL